MVVTLYLYAVMAPARAVSAITEKREKEKEIILYERGKIIDYEWYLRNSVNDMTQIRTISNLIHFYLKKWTVLLRLYK